MLFVFCLFPYLLLLFVFLLTTYATCMFFFRGEAFYFEPFQKFPFSIRLSFALIFVLVFGFVFSYQYDHSLFSDFIFAIKPLDTSNSLLISFSFSKILYFYHKLLVFSVWKVFFFVSIRYHNKIIFSSRKVI